MGFNSIAPWLAPKITKMISKGQETSELYHSARNLSLLISLSALLGFSFIYTPVLELILGTDKFIKTEPFIRLFMLFELFFVYSIIPNYFLNASGHEKLYFKLVLFYCFAILTGMSLGYMFSRSADGLLIGMSFATGISMFVQDVIINDKVFGKKGIADSLLLFLPAICIAASFVSPTPILKIALSLLSASVVYMIFFKFHKINFNLVRLD
jgi:hypothetical protein